MSNICCTLSCGTIVTKIPVDIASHTGIDDGSRILNAQIGEYTNEQLLARHLLPLAFGHTFDVSEHFFNTFRAYYVHMNAAASNLTFDMLRPVYGTQSNLRYTGAFV